MTVEDGVRRNYNHRAALHVPRYGILTLLIALLTGDLNLLLYTIIFENNNAPHAKISSPLFTFSVIIVS